MAYATFPPPMCVLGRLLWVLRPNPITGWDVFAYGPKQLVSAQEMRRKLHKGMAPR